MSPHWLRSHYKGVRATRYEQARVRDPKWHREQEVVRELLGEVIEETSAVVDVPVGTGRFLQDYAELGCRLVGIDISPDMLRQAAQRAAEYPSLNIDLQAGDITSLPLPDNAVDVAVCIRFASLVNSRVLDTAVSELARVARHVILGVTTRLPPSDDDMLTKRLIRWAHRTARAYKPGPRRVVAHDATEVASIFSRHSLSTKRLCEVRRRDVQGDVTTIYLLRKDP